MDFDIIDDTLKAIDQAESSRLRRALQVQKGRDIPIKTLNRILNGKAKNVPDDVLRDIVDVVKTLPQRRIVNEKRARASSIPLTDEMLEALRGELERTNVAIKTLSRAIPAFEARDVQQHVNNWLYGTSQSANAHYWNAVMDWLGQQGSAGSFSRETYKPPRKEYPLRDGYVPITQEDIAAIQALRKQTGITYTALAERDDVPAGFSKFTISKWICGQTRTARKETLVWVFRAYRENIQINSD